MERKPKIYLIATIVAVFIALPMLLYALSDFPTRTWYKELISVTTIVAFFVMLMQFFLSRVGKNIVAAMAFKQLITWHKALGYTFVSILLLHPLLIVLPRFFEAGIAPTDAFITMVTTNKQGIILGIIAWGLMIVIGVTSFFRFKLGMKYTNWRVVHGILSIAFITVASFHVIDLGRHITLRIALLIAIVAIVAVSLLLKMYLFRSSK